MKYQFMRDYQHEFKIERMSSVFNVSSSGYYKFILRKPTARAQENDRLLNKIVTSYHNSRKTYGSPRICSELKAGGEVCSRKRIARIMRQHNMAAKMKKRFKVTTKANPNAIPAPNLLQQNFTVAEPNRRWVADFTYIDTKEGWLYVAAVMDLFSRRIIGLAMSDRMQDELVITALQQAFMHRQPGAGLIHHSDRGSQYTSKNFKDLLIKYRIVASMSGTGNCYDNAVIESFFHTLKTEHVYFERYATRDQARCSIFEYIEVFYNRKRRHSTLNYLSPVVFENQWQQAA
jgi:transposase InsO family protein